jgi:mono/diheme cytochrome c family protein
VGIWWTIGLASPLATETLIHTFVFGWAIEYVFFVLEVAAAFIFYYGWAKLEPKTHQTIGWIYAGAAWISLVLITAITAFMLNPGAWPQHRSFWIGFLNPQFAPQTLARTGGAFLLSSLYVYLHAAFKIRDAELRDLISKRAVQPGLLGVVLAAIGGAGWYVYLPESAQAALAAASVLNVLLALLVALAITLAAMLYCGPYRNPGWISPGFAILFFASGLAAVSVGEFLREAVRKPYVIYNVVLGNQVLAEEIPGLRRGGYLEGGVWTRAWVATHYPQVMSAGKIEEEKLLTLPAADQRKLGQVLFQYHCNDCHAADSGYSPVGHMIRGWPRARILSLVLTPEEVRFFMPPWAGTAAEAELLTEYLVSIAPAHPGGMYYGNGR